MKLQNKKNLRQRMNRLHLSTNKISNYKIAIAHQGSLKKGSGPVKKKENGLYDLDVDFIIKTNDSAKAVREDIAKAIEECLRNHEVLENKKRVVRIKVNEDGYNYNYDIAIKNFNNETATYENGKYLWKK